MERQKFLRQENKLIKSDQLYHTGINTSLFPLYFLGFSLLLSHMHYILAWRSWQRHSYRSALDTFLTGDLNKLDQSSCVLRKKNCRKHTRVHARAHTSLSSQTVTWLQTFCKRNFFIHENSLGYKSLFVIFH